MKRKYYKYTPEYMGYLTIITGPTVRTFGLPFKYRLPLYGFFRRYCGKAEMFKRAFVTEKSSVEQ